MTFYGTVTGIDPKIDPQTRLVSVQALIDNTNDELRPGQFIRVRVELPTEEGRHRRAQTAIDAQPLRRLCLRRRGGEADPPPCRQPPAPATGSPAASRGRARARRPAGLRQDRAAERCRDRNPERALRRREDRHRRPETPDQRRSGEDRQHRRSANQAAFRTPDGLSTMNFSELFIRRPVLSVVVGLMILLLGVQGIMSMAIRQYPEGPGDRHHGDDRLSGRQRRSDARLHHDADRQGGVEHGERRLRHGVEPQGVSRSKCACASARMPTRR